MQTDKLFRGRLFLDELFIIEPNQENEWRLLNSFSIQLLSQSVYDQFGTLYLANINNALQHTFLDLQKLGQLMHIIIKIRKDVIYTTYKESNTDETSMFHTFCQLQQNLKEGHFKADIQPHLKSYQLTKYTIMDLLAFNHLNKSRSFHRVITKKVPEKLTELWKWYQSISQEFDVPHLIDPQYLPKKEKRSKMLQEDKKQQNPELIQTITENDFEKFKIMIAAGASIYSVADRDKMMVPHVVCLYERMQFAEYLTSLNVDWECEDADKMTPFFYAIKANSNQLITYLHNRVNIEHADIQDRTPFYYACSLGDLQTIKYLQKLNANINSKTALGRTPFSKSAFLGLYQVVEFLLDCPGIEASYGDKQGRNALHNAAFGPKGGREGKKVGTWGRDSPQIVQLLLEKGLDVESKDKDDNTPLHVAASSEALESMPLLVAFGGNVNARNKWQETPLMVAAKFNHFDSANTLISLGADPYLMNEGLLPYEIAAKQGQLDVFKYLLDVIKIENPYKQLLKLMKITQLCKPNPFVTQYLNSFSNIFANENTVQVDDTEFINLIFEMKDCQQQLLDIYPKKISDSTIQRYFELSLKKKNLNPFYLIVQKESDYQIELRKSTIEQAIENIDLFFDYNIQWFRYRSRAEETFLERIIQKHKTQLMVRIIDFFQLIRDGKPIPYKNKTLHSITVKDIDQIMKREYTLSEYALMHNCMDIYQVVQRFEGVNEGPRFIIPAYEIELVIDNKKEKEVIQDDFEIVNCLNFTHQEVAFIANSKLNLLQKQLNLIETPQALRDCLKELNNYTMLGIDTEHYSDKKDNIPYRFICTIQISTIDSDYIVDVMQLRDQNGELNQIFSNPKQVKIFHGSETDLRALQQDLRINVVNLYDTAKMDLMLREHHNEHSLQKLCLDYLGLHLDKLYQKSDWRIRPLPQEMLEYARMDSGCLLLLFPLLLKKIKEANLLEKVQQSCQKRVNMGVYVNVISKQ